MAQSRWRRPPRPGRQVNHGDRVGYTSDRGRGGNDAIRAALREAAQRISQERREQLRQTLSKEDISAIAMEVSGTSDTKSRAYKSARRSVERRVTPAGQKRGVSGRRTVTGQQIDAAIARRLQLQERTPTRGEISFLDADVIQFSLIDWELEFNDYPAGRRPNHSGYLYRDDLEPALSALRRGRFTDAIDRLHNAMVADYGRPENWLYSRRAGDTQAGRQNVAIASAQRVIFSRSRGP